MVGWLCGKKRKDLILPGSQGRLPGRDGMGFKSQMLTRSRQGRSAQTVG